jgi:hypothetical protein
MSYVYQQNQVVLEALVLLMDISVLLVVNTGYNFSQLSPFWN